MSCKHTEPFNGIITVTATPDRCPPGFWCTHEVQCPGTVRDA